MAATKAETHDTKFKGRQQQSGGSTKWLPKNPFNTGSRDPLHPPSKDENYTLFSGIPIIDLYKATLQSDEGKANASERARKQASPAIIAAGSHKGKVNWKRLFENENQCIIDHSTFGLALANLRNTRPEAPFLHTNLHLESWLSRLDELNTVEAADAYWGISRGIEVIPSNPDRIPTTTPNYFDKKHEDLVREEIKRVVQDGYICSYDELKAIWPDLPDGLSDSLGLGFIVKTRPDGTLKVRLIIDCSRPDGCSVNSEIKDYSTALPTVVEFARYLQEGDWMVSADIADAFHNLGLQPHNWSNVGMNVSLDTNEGIDLAYT